MEGEGKRRSEWNTLLLRDVIAPIYANLVVKARQVGSDKLRASAVQLGSGKTREGKRTKTPQAIHLHQAKGSTFASSCYQ